MCPRPLAGEEVIAQQMTEKEQQLPILQELAAMALECYALPDAVGGRQRRETAGDHAANSVHGHGHFPYPGQRAWRLLNQSGFLGIQAAGVLADHFQMDLTQAAQTGGQGARTV